MVRPRVNLRGPLTRWEGYAFALIFIVVVWQFGHYLDHRRALSDVKAQTQNASTAHTASQLKVANKKLQVTARKQVALNTEDRHLRNAVCTLLDGIPAPPKGTQFGGLWRHARRESQCGKVTVVHTKRPSSPAAPTTTTSVSPAPSVSPTAPARKPTKHHRARPHPVTPPEPRCILPTGMHVPCVRLPHDLDGPVTR